MTPQERADFDRLHKLVEQLVRVEHPPFIENLKRRIIGTEITDALATLDLEDLRNVTITTPTSGQVLEWNGSAWVNATDNT
jgi:hypothetical protein